MNNINCFNRSYTFTPVMIFFQRVKGVIQKGDFWGDKTDIQRLTHGVLRMN